jgi:succinyl-diaminopimelate desuccinylase
MSQTLELAQALIARPSVTPDDAGCQALIAARLRPLGFAIEAMVSGEVENLWARRGNERPLLVFAGHTDVVPAGPREDWASDPFSPTIRDGLLFGRGAADMKGGLAAMVTAIERFVAAQPRHRGSIAMLLTSDEEGPSIDGTVKVVEKLESRGEKLDWCLVGDPSSEEHIGDTVKIGRRGSLNGVLRFRGVQGHVAYPQHARNPIHCVLPALAELVASEWDRGNDHFPPTGFQISNIHAGTGAENVIPGTIEVMFNLRFGTAQTAADLQARVAESLERRGLYGEIDWRLSGNPFLTPAGDLIDATRRAVRSITGAEPRLSTSGGTSDGRFIAPTGAQVVELGLLNTTIHKVDECVPVADLDILSRIYEQLLANLIAG